MNLLRKNGKQLILNLLYWKNFQDVVLMHVVVIQSDMKMQDVTNLETTYTHACKCMYGMYYARWHEKTMGWILCIIHCDMNPSESMLRVKWM